MAAAAVPGWFAAYVRGAVPESFAGNASSPPAAAAAARFFACHAAPCAVFPAGPAAVPRPRHRPANKGVRARGLRSARMEGRRGEGSPGGNGDPPGVRPKGVYGPWTPAAADGSAGDGRYWDPWAAHEPLGGRGHTRGFRGGGGGVSGETLGSGVGTFGGNSFSGGDRLGDRAGAGPAPLAGAVRVPRTAPLFL